MTEPTFYLYGANNKKHYMAPVFPDFLLGILTRTLNFPITSLCLGSHAAPLLYKMISLFMHVHKSQFIQLLISVQASSNEMVNLVYDFQTFTSQRSVFIKDYT